MAKLRDYFDTDFSRCVRLSTGCMLQGKRADGTTISGEIPFVSIWDEKSNARFPTFFIPKELAMLQICMHVVDRCEAAYHEAWDGLRTIGGTADWGDYDQVDSATLVDTRQVYLYVDRDLSPEERAQLRSGSTNLP